MKKSLPPLAFGDNIAIIHENARDFSDLIDKVFSGVNAYEPIFDGKKFFSKSNVLKLPNTRIVSSAISPTLVDRHCNDQLAFMIPFSGDPEATCQVGKQQKIHWGLGKGGLFLPQTDERVVGTGGFRSQIMWQLNRDLLTKTAMAMLGLTEPVDLFFDDARILPNEINGVRTDSTWHAIIPLLQLHSQYPQMLSNLGIEDLIYRQSVMLLRPDLFATHGSENHNTPSRSQKLLDRLCEYIVEHLSEPWTLTDLEHVSGMSGRSLQMAFNSQLACSPMAWIKEQRLLKVRNELGSNPAHSIESIALAVGFQSMPAFFLAYKKRFGETPGQTRVK